MYNPQLAIRKVLTSLHPSVAHKAAEAPDVREIYTPKSHADALDPDRALVVGGRGVGKSFWAATLADPAAKKRAAEAYPQLKLDHVDVQLGFHEGAQGAGMLAPSPGSLKLALDIVDDPVWIWRSVLLQAVNPNVGPRRLTDRVKWLMHDPETYDELTYAADQKYAQSGRRLLIVFDALDVLANDWDTIRRLTIGLARLALETGSRRSIRIKMFMRTDHFQDMKRKTFADFSKLRTAAVELDWRTVDLYGALFARLWRDEHSSRAAKDLAEKIRIRNADGKDLPYVLRDNELAQQKFFALFAGEFMGANEKRGRTYTWVPKHLADGHGETSLRSFLIALKEAALRGSERSRLAIDYVGINEGVLKASDTRREEIQEDHPWVEDALSPLSGLTVPCDEDEIHSRWDDAHVYEKIVKRSDPERPAVPAQLSLVDLDREPWGGEIALMEALVELGVAERRNMGRVNFPDIYRVAAKMKRRGGVAPRKN